MTKNREFEALKLAQRSELVKWSQQLYICSMHQLTFYVCEDLTVTDIVSAIQLCSAQAKKRLNQTRCFES